MRNNGKSVHSPPSQRVARRRSQSCPPQVRASTRTNRTRIGKIARLPNDVREKLNRRLLDGEEGQKLLDWLNGLSQTRRVLSAQFGGRPISKQNLSEWNQGGYRDWLRAEEDRLRVDRLIEHAARLAGLDDEGPLSERLATVLLVELAGTLDESRDDSLPPAERWQLLRQMLREVAQMRREDHRAAQLRIEKERWELERDKLDDEQAERVGAKRKQILCAPFEAWSQMPLLAQAYGGDERGRAFAARVLEIRHDLKRGTLYVHKPSNRVKPGQGESGPGNGSDGSDGSDESTITEGSGR